MVLVFISTREPRSAAESSNGFCCSSSCGVHIAKNLPASSRVIVYNCSLILIEPIKTIFGLSSTPRTHGLIDIALHHSQGYCALSSIVLQLSSNFCNVFANAILIRGKACKNTCAFESWNSCHLRDLIYEYIYSYHLSQNVGSL